jgi:hypothetical protein
MSAKYQHINTDKEHRDEVGAERSEAGSDNE